jgi:hypothetical protein
MVNGCCRCYRSRFANRHGKSRTACRAAATIAETPRAVAASCEYIMTSLADDAAVEAVFYGLTESLPARAQARLYELSTIAPPLRGGSPKRPRGTRRSRAGVRQHGTKEAGTLTFRRRQRSDVSTVTSDLFANRSMGSNGMGVTMVGANAPFGPHAGAGRGDRPGREGGLKITARRLGTPRSSRQVGKETRKRAPFHISRSLSHCRLRTGISGSFSVKQLSSLSPCRRPPSLKVPCAAEQRGGEEDYSAVIGLQRSGAYH